jgi:hypothetical protein
VAAVVAVAALAAARGVVPAALSWRRAVVAAVVAVARAAVLAVARGVVPAALSWRPAAVAVVAVA